MARRHNGRCPGVFMTHPPRLPLIWQVNLETGALIGLALQRDPAFVQFDQSLDQGQAQAGPAPFTADITVKNMRLNVIRNAAPGIGHFQHQLLALFQRR